MEDAKGKTAKFFQRVLNEAVPIFERATVGFYGIHEGTIVKDRTGVLFRIADALFILTASHDLRDIVRSNIPLYVSWNERTQIPIPLCDSRFHTTEWESRIGERDVVRDVAAIKLSEAIADEILVGGRQPMTLADISANQDRSPAVFLMFGFPQAWFSVDDTGPKCLPLSYGCSLFAGDHWPGSQIEYDPKVHLLLDFKRDAVDPIDGQRHTLPGYRGIKGVSGCGIWRIIDMPGSVERWTPAHCKLVAIQHRYYEQAGYLHTTWIHYAVGRIFEDYPELKSATTIVYPR